MKPDLLSETIYRSLDEIIRPSSCCAWIDFPNHSNVGDSSIWLGERDYLSNRNISIRYLCDATAYKKMILATCHPKGPILIHGGGNFGDLWPIHQQLREQVLLDFPDRLVVQLPQSIHFEDPKNLKRAVKAINNHERFVLMVRDWQSLELAKKHFHCTVTICPDMAFAMDQKRMKDRFRNPECRVLYLSRTDKEASQWKTTAYHRHENVLVLDWIAVHSRYRSIFYKLANRLERFKCSFLWIWAQKFRLIGAQGIARKRLSRGLKLLSFGERVVTDRLHGMILALLMKRPVYVFDNSYRKLSCFYNAWLRGVEKLSFCLTEAKALESALS